MLILFNHRKCQQYIPKKSFLSMNILLILIFILYYCSFEHSYVLCQSGNRPSYTQLPSPSIILPSSLTLSYQYQLGSTTSTYTTEYIPAEYGNSIFGDPLQ